MWFFLLVLWSPQEISILRRSLFTCGPSVLITTSPRYGVVGLLRRRRAQYCPGSGPSAKLAVSDLEAQLNMFIGHNYPYETSGPHSETTGNIKIFKAKWLITSKSWFTSCCWLDWGKTFSSNHENSFWPPWLIASLSRIESFSFALSGRQGHKWMNSKWHLTASDTAAVQ